MKISLIALFVMTVLGCEIALGQQLPRSLRSYLNRNYRGWKLAGQCSDKESDNHRILVGDFDGNGKRDYAVKFVTGKRGFFMAFLAIGGQWKPLYLHIWSDPDYARYSDLITFKPGESWDMEGTGAPKFRFDTPADFRCESDVGGPHAYKNGKFIAY